MRSLTCFLVAAVVLACALPARAQEPAPPPAHISFVEGTATVVHGDDSEPAAINMPVVEGDRIQTSGNARVEVMFPDGSAIEIDPDSDVEFLSATRVRVIAGAIEHRAAAAPDPQSPSTEYLPPDLQSYGPDLDQSGSWQYDAQYGNVWYPTAITADWRPYYYGYWAAVPTYGWTWIGYDRWAWPTHHYGRWGYARNRWFWIPGPTFAAAWVSWGTAVDYVSWCPLGFDGRPVVALSVGYHHGWNAWTVMRRDEFGSRRYSAYRYGFEPYRLAANTAFIEHRTPPAFRARDARAVGSRQPTLGAHRQPSAGSRAVRSTNLGVAVPRYGNRSPEGRITASQSDSSSTEYRRRVPGAVSAAPSRERVVPIAPSAAQPATSAVPRAGDQPSTTDHPAYRSRYQPRYEPRYEPRFDAPPAAPPASASPYRERRMPGAGARATTSDPRPAATMPAPVAVPRYSAPASGARQPQNDPGPRRESVAPRASSPPPAAPSHGAAGPRSEGVRSGSHSQSAGTAVRRPR